MLAASAVAAGSSATWFAAGVRAGGVPCRAFAQQTTVSRARRITSAASDRSLRQSGALSRSAAIREPGGEGIAAQIPLAATIQSSFTHTDAAQPQPPANNYGVNNNFNIDQISVFLAGRITDYAGGFVQTTWSGTNRAILLDNTDLRLTTPLSVGDSELRIGVSLKQRADRAGACNSTFVWMFPFIPSSTRADPDGAAAAVGWAHRQFGRTDRLCLVRPATVCRSRGLWNLWPEPAVRDRQSPGSGQHCQISRPMCGRSMNGTGAPSRRISAGCC